MNLKSNFELEVQTRYIISYAGKRGRLFERGTWQMSLFIPTANRYVPSCEVKVADAPYTLRVKS